MTPCAARPVDERERYGNSSRGHGERLHEQLGLPVDVNGAETTLEGRGWLREQRGLPVDMNGTEIL